VKEKVGVGISKDVAIQLFRQGDEDNDGEIDRQELGWLTSEMATSVSQIKGVYQQCATGKSGSVSIKDCDDEGMKAIVNAFAGWDQDGDGMISTEDLGSVLLALNPSLTQISVDLIMKEADTSGDGEINVSEFVSWLAGENLQKKKLKKKAKEEKEAKIATALHRKRAEEARASGLQRKFEESQHAGMGDWCTKRKINAACNTLNAGPGASLLCTSCNGRHAWVCHSCGFVSFYDDCVNGCSQGTYGWTCLYGTCPKKKCGCKKKKDIWQRTGFTGTVDTLAANLRVTFAEPEAS